jgi:diguanylate cyclase (GGDEF)-like protein
MCGATNQRLLIVDDDPYNIHLLANIFNNDYDISFATDGKKALEMALKEKPDLILLDVVMPEMNGYDVCRELKGNPATLEIPIIFVTAHSDAAEEIRGLEIGAADYISKPFCPAIIKIRVKNQIELKQLQDKLVELATTDGLTGISNRRCFDQKLAEEWHRALRAKKPLTVVMLDVDFFKKYNDYYGHIMGDECLKQIANILVSNCNRNIDFVARYGGEEFAMILPETQSPLTLMEKLFQTLDKLAIPHAMSESGQVTLSIGVSMRVPKQGENQSTLVREADEALYTAKHQGRNRAVQYQASYWVNFNAEKTAS